MTAAELAILDLRGVAISAALEADGTFRPVGGIEAKALALLRGNSLPLPTTLVVAKDQDLSFLSEMRSGPPEEAVWTCRDGHGVFQVVRAANAADAVHQLAVIRGPWTRVIPDFSLWVNQHRGFVGREWLAARFHEFLAGDTASYWLLTAEPGWGKSAFLIHFLRQLDNEQEPPPVGRRWLPIRHFLKQGYGTWTDPTALLRSLIAQVRREAGLGWDESVLKGELRSLQSALQDTLQQAAQRLPPDLGLLLCIDGLDETFGPQGTDPRVALPGVLPERLPPGIKAVLTSRPGRHLSWLADARICQTEALQNDTADNLADIRTYLHEARRAEHLRTLPLSDGFVDALERAAEGNFLAAVLYLGPRPGLAGELAERQADLARIPKGLDGFLEDQWNRLVRSAAGVRLTERFVRTLLGLVALAREPLSWEQWQTVLNLAYRAPRLKHTYVPTKKEVLKLSQRGVELLELAAGFFSLDGDNGSRRRFGFFHTRLAQFVDERLGAERAGLHAVLGGACQAAWRAGPALVQDYALRWVPTHWLEAQEWDLLAGVLCDLGFVEARVRAQLLGVLLADYAATLAVLPERQEQGREALRRQEDVARWTGEITAYARAWSRIRAGEADPASAPPLPQPVAAVPWRSEAELEAERERIIRAPGRADRVEAFANWVGVRTPALSEHGHREGFVLQEALNWARNGPVREVAEAALPDCKATLLLEQFPPEWTPRPACLLTLAGHTRWVQAVAITADGTWAVSGSDDGTVRVWDLTTGQSRELRGHTTGVSAVAVTPNGARAISGSFDGMLLVWDLATGQSRELRGHTKWVAAVAITPDGARAISGSHDHTVRVWDVATGQSRELRGHTKWVAAVAITSDGTRAVSGSEDRTLRVWELATGQGCGLRGAYGFGLVAVTPDGTRAVSGSEGGTLRVWELATGHGRALSGHNLDVTAVAITPNGRRAVASTMNDDVVLVWDLATSQCRELAGHTWKVCAVAVTPDGTRVASASYDKTVRVWDLSAGQSRELRGDTGRVRAVAITTDGTRAVSSVGNDETVRVWDLATGQCRELRGHTGGALAIAIATEGTRAVSSAFGDLTVRVWDLATGQSRELRGHTRLVTAAAITPDGTQAATSGSEDTTVRVWDLATGQSRELPGHRGGVMKIAITPNGERVVSWGRFVTLVWDLATGQSRELRVHTDEVKVAITPKGKCAVTGSSRGTVRVWDLSTGQSRELGGHSDFVTAVAITPDGTRAVSSAISDKTVRVWDLATGQSRELRGHNDSINAVAITPDGTRAVSGSDDHTVRVWDLATGQNHVLLCGRAPVIRVAVACDGQGIVAGDTRGRVHLLRLHGPMGGVVLP